MDKYKDIGILLPQQNLVKYCQEVISVGGEHTSKLYNTVYEEISEEFGSDVAIKIYQMYKGMQITFPTRLFNPDYVKKQISIEYDGSNVKQLAKKYGYSEKTIRRMIKEI
ncbi:MAG: Mor transcription activator family protein [Clostridiales bacterium]|nr:Mor transcription activator family protein [Clostridiales bacterium]